MGEQLLTKNSHIINASLGPRVLPRADGFKPPKVTSTGKKVRRGGKRRQESTGGKQNVDNAQIGWIIDDETDIDFFRSCIGRKDISFPLATQGADGNDNGKGPVTHYLGHVHGVEEDDTDSTGDSDERWVWVEQSTDDVKKA